MKSFTRLFADYRALHSIAVIPNAQRTVLQSLQLRIGAGRFRGALSHQYGAVIDLNAEIGEGVIFDHEFHGLFIAGAAQIGNGTVIMQHVTIGDKLYQGRRDNLDRARFAPRIGERVFIGANATLIGRCIVGDMAKIGAGVTLVDAASPEGAVIVNASAFDLTNGRPVYPRVDRWSAP